MAEDPIQIQRRGVRTALGKLLLLIAGLGIGLGCAEGVLRVLDPPFFGRMRGFDAELGWIGNPDSVSYRRFEHGLIRFGFNSEGFRDLPHRRNTGGLPLKRIALIGDSFTESAQVELHKTFTSRLKDLLNDDPKEYWEVQNFGVSDFGTAQELMVLERFALDYEPDLVILQVFPLNDITNNSLSAAYVSSRQDTYRPYLDPDDNFQSFTYLNPSSQWVRRRSVLGRHTLQLIQNRWGGWGRERFFKNNTERLAWVERRCVELGLPEGCNQKHLLMNVFSPHDEQLPMIQEGWSATEQGILSIYRKVNDSGARFMVLVVPHLRQLGPYWEAWSSRVAFNVEADYAEQRITELLDGEPVPVIGLLESFRESFDVVDPYLEGHFNLETHALVAEILDREVRRQMGKAPRIEAPSDEPEPMGATDGEVAPPEAPEL